MTRGAAWLLLGLVLSAPLARASEAVDALLLEASNADLRARLLAHAASAPDSLERGEAFFYAGMSYERSGLPDSAIRCYERAVSLRAAPAELDAYADALTLRGGKGDVPRAVAALRTRMELARRSTEHEIADTQGRLGWAWYVAERADSALLYLRHAERWLLDPINPLRRVWRYRLGAVEFEHGDPYRGMEVLSWLAVDSHFQDREVMDLLRKLSDRAKARAGLEMTLKSRRQEADALEQIVIDTLGGRRVTFQGRDGFPLGAVAIPARSSQRSRAAIVLVPPDDPLEAFDSLAAGMRRAGYSLLMLDGRGSGRSVAPSCPLPESWAGREVEMIEQSSSDVPLALRALSGAARVDTSAYLVVGIGPTAPIAASAAARDPRVRALVLVGPAPAPVDRGAMRARLKAFARPVFFEIPASEHETLPVAEALYQVTDVRASRISESDRPGDGTRLFRYDPGALPRMLRWIDESWAAGRGGKSR